MNTKPIVFALDDEEINLRCLEETLEDMSLELQCFQDPKLFLQTLEEENRIPDLVILDIMMPEMDGYEVLKKIRHMCKFIPVLMLTAKNREESLVHSFKEGATDYLSKPIADKEDELMARVSSLLDSNRRLQNSNEIAIEAQKNKENILEITHLENFFMQERHPVCQELPASYSTAYVKKLIELVYSESDIPKDISGFLAFVLPEDEKSYGSFPKMFTEGKIANFNLYAPLKNQFYLMSATGKYLKSLSNSIINITTKHKDKIQTVISNHKDIETKNYYISIYRKFDEYEKKHIGCALIAFLENIPPLSENQKELVQLFLKHMSIFFASKWFIFNK